MKENNVAKAIEFLNHSLNELVQGKVPMDKLAITKALRSYYKNPQQIAHWVLSERIGKRDPGNKPKSGERIKFIYFNNSNPKALQGDRIEIPEFIQENKLKIDYNHYITNQLMKPIQQLFGLALEQIWALQNKPKEIVGFQKEMKKLRSGCDDFETYMKKREKYCSARVKTLLFDSILTKINNDKRGLRSILDFM
jgi:DNA polymerase elongation subunit (family B)